MPLNSNNITDIVSYINVLESKILVLEEETDSLISIAAEVTNTSRNAILALVKADTAISEINTATADSVAGTGSKLKDTLTRIKDGSLVIPDTPVVKEDAYMLKIFQFSTSAKDQADFKFGASCTGIEKVDTDNSYMTLGLYYGDVFFASDENARMFDGGMNMPKITNLTSEILYLTDKVGAASDEVKRQAVKNLLTDFTIPVVRSFEPDSKVGLNFTKLFASGTSGETGDGVLADDLSQYSAEYAYAVFLVKHKPGYSLKDNNAAIINAYAKANPPENVSMESFTIGLTSDHEVTSYDYKVLV